MRGKWLLKFGGTTEGQNGRQKQSKSTVKPVGHGPLTDVSGSSSVVSASISYDQKETKDISHEDVNKAAEDFINKVHRDFELQRTLSDRRYYGYLERAT